MNVVMVLKIRSDISAYRRDDWPWNAIHTRLNRDYAEYKDELKSVRKAMAAEGARNKALKRGVRPKVEQPQPEWKQMLLPF